MFSKRQGMLQYHRKITCLRNLSQKSESDREIHISYSDTVYNNHAH